jgi:PAS domain S-box-containing protein
MTDFFGLSIRKLLYLMILIMAIPTAGIIIYSGIDKRNEDIEEACEEAQNLADGIASDERNLVAGAQQLVSTLAQMPEVVNHDAGKVQQLLSEILRLNPQYLNIFIADQTGSMWASAIPSKFAINVADRQHFINARETGRFSSGEGVNGRLLHTITQGFSYPIKNRLGEFVGVIVVNLDMNNFRNRLQQSKLTAGSNYLIVDRKGMILSKGLNSSPSAGSQIRPELLQIMQEGPEAGETVKAAIDDTERFTYFRKLRLSGEQTPYLYVVAGIPVTAATAAANHALYRHLALLTPFMMIALFLAGLIVKRSIVDPVRLLEQASQRLAEGDLGVRIATHISGGEFGRLGSAFDEMAKSLADRGQERDASEAALRKSESYYRSIFDNSLFGIALTGADMKFSHVNETFCRLVGYEEQELIGVRGFLDVTHPDDIEESRRMHEKMQRMELTHYSIEKRYLTKSGQTVSCACFAKRIDDDDHLYAGHSGCILDITELRANEEKMRLFFERQVVGTAITSADKKWIKTNQKLQRMLGYSGEELAGMTWEELTHPDDLDSNRNLFDAMLDGKIDEYLVEKKFVRKDGSPLHAALSVGCVRKHDGRVDYILLVVIDITKRKMAEEEVCQLHRSLELRVLERTAQLEEAMREQEAFSYSVSHDLRGPLRHINSFAAILDEDFGESLIPEAKGYLDRIRASSHRMGRLIDDLLELSRIGRSELCKAPVNLSELASDIALKLKEAEPQRCAEFIIQPELTVLGDKVLMWQMLENLIGNAWKYSSRSECACIELGRDRDVFFVKDNGVGFDMAYQGNLFGPFQRLHGSEFEGAGIGLATVKRIVERHEGSVWAEAVVDQGATIFFTIP